MQVVQRILFAVFVGIGCAIGLSPIMNYIHEYGHLESFQSDGITSAIIATDKTSTAEITESGLIAGIRGEFMYPFLAFWLFMIISKPGSQNLRDIWCHLGLPLGMCTAIFLKAFSYSDFNREYSTHIIETWIIVALSLLLVSWIAVLATWFNR